VDTRAFACAFAQALIVANPKFVYDYVREYFAARLCASTLRDERDVHLLKCGVPFKLSRLACQQDAT